jgi:hypothetical protein
MATRLATLVAITLALTGLTAAQALADGDPASDVLLGQNVFYPYSPAVTSSLQKTLDGETASAKKAGFPLKVALIASPVDLGVVPDLFDKPQQYASFLDQEISYMTKQPLLVVMASGYGVVGVSAPATSAVAGLSKPAGSQTDALAHAAIAAVPKLAAAAGHPIASGSAGGAKRGGGSTVLIVVLVVAAVLTAGVLGAVTVRRRRTAA